MSRWLLRAVAVMATLLAVAMPYSASDSTNGRVSDVRGSSALGPVLDRSRHISERTIDSNHDGRTDVREYYEDGELVRRESDRNFDDAIDLIEDFSAATHELERSVIDLDFDGVADRLVLFRNRRSVFFEDATKEQRRGVLANAPVAFRLGTDDALRPLVVPFDTELTLRHGLPAFGSSGAPWTVATTFLSVPVWDLTTPVLSTAHVGVSRPVIADFGPRLRPSRAPPLV